MHVFTIASRPYVAVPTKVEIAQLAALTDNAKSLQSLTLFPANQNTLYHE
jgi:hypothetical protein